MGEEGGGRSKWSTPLVLGAVSLAVLFLLSPWGFGFWGAGAGPGESEGGPPPVRWQPALDVAVHGRPFDDPEGRGAPVSWPSRRAVLACEVLDELECDR